MRRRPSSRDGGLVVCPRRTPTRGGSPMRAAPAGDHTGGQCYARRDAVAVLTAVQQQYEVLPYPPRDPERELEELRQPSLAELPRIVEALWSGQRRIDSEFRVLDAGCGTGDNTIFLAEQLRGTGAQVVALDFSSTSLEIA